MFRLGLQTVEMYKGKIGGGEERDSGEEDDKAEMGQEGMRKRKHAELGFREETK